MGNFQLPNQKGVELWPQVTRSSVQIRFAGVVPGSDLARELYAQHRGTIDRFYLAQAQNYALSTVTMAGKVVSQDGLKLRYMNQSGQETVFVEVPELVVRKRQEEVQETSRQGVIQYFAIDIVNQSAANYSPDEYPEVASTGGWVEYTGFFGARLTGSAAAMVEDSPLDGPVGDEILTFCRNQTFQGSIVWLEELAQLPIRLGSLRVKVDASKNSQLSVDIFALAIPDFDPDPPDTILWDVRGKMYNEDLVPVAMTHPDGSGIWLSGDGWPRPSMISGNNLLTNDIPSGPGPGGAKLIGTLEIDAIASTAVFSPSLPFA